MNAWWRAGWAEKRKSMTARRTAFHPLSSSRIPAERKGAAERVHNPECFDSSPQEPEKPAATPSGLPAVGAVGGPGPVVVDESSDSEGEQEGPQKLIRKVSTSGQIRSKVRHAVSYPKPVLCVLLFMSRPVSRRWCYCSPAHMVDVYELSKH